MPSALTLGQIPVTYRMTQTERRTRQNEQNLFAPLSSPTVNEPDMPANAEPHMAAVTHEGDNDTGPASNDSDDFPPLTVPARAARW